MFYAVTGSTRHFQCKLKHLIGGLRSHTRTYQSLRVLLVISYSKCHVALHMLRNYIVAAPWS